MDARLSSQQGEISNKDKALLLGILFLPCILINQSFDNDIWFILNNGRYVLQYGIPHIEPFTFHQGMAYVMQQWLSSVIFWAIYSKLGTAGLTVLIMIAFAGIIWTTFRVCMRISKDNFFVSLAVTLFSSVFTGIFMVQRPFIFFLLLVAIEVYLLESYIEKKRLSYLLPLPVLSVLLVNLQAAMWPVLFIILIPYIIDSINFRIFFIKGQGYSKKAFYIIGGIPQRGICLKSWGLDAPMILIIAIMIMAGVINPYGIDGMTYLFRSYGYKEINSFITEMKPLDINSFFGKVIFLLIFCIILIYFIHKNGDTRIRYILLTIGTIIMTLSSVRSFLILSFCGIVPLSYHLRDVKINEGRLWEKGSSIVMLIRRLLIFIICILIVFTIYIKFQDARKEAQESLLPGTVDYILNNADVDKITLYTGYSDGGYAEFRGLKPYIDPRAEVFLIKNNKKYDIMKEYCLLQTGSEYYRNFLDKYNFTHLIVSKDDILYNYLPYDKDYGMAYSNKDYRVYEKIK